MLNNETTKKYQITATNCKRLSKRGNLKKSIKTIERKELSGNRIPSTHFEKYYFILSRPFLSRRRNWLLRVEENQKILLKKIKEFVYTEEKLSSI